jgi:hypothetical protein
MMDEVTIYDDATWGKYGKDLVPAPLYQVYRINGIWIGDDESLWYSFEPGEDAEASTIEIVDKNDPSYVGDEMSKKYKEIKPIEANIFWNK